MHGSINAVGAWIAQERPDPDYFSILFVFDFESDRSARYMQDRMNLLVFLF